MESNARCNMYRISIGSEYSRWNELKAALRLKTNAEVAKTLLDAYIEKSINPAGACSSTPEKKI